MNVREMITFAKEQSEVFPPDSLMGDFLRSVLKETNRLQGRMVTYSGDGYTNGEIVLDYANCPNCGCESEEDDQLWEEPYCPHCGQRLIWRVGP